MPKLTKADLGTALDVVYDVCSAQSADPFPLAVLARLGELLGVHTVGYCETPRTGELGGYELVTRPAPPWLFDELRLWGLQDPIHAAFHAETTTPIAISDFLSGRAFNRLEVYQRICRRNHVADSWRIYLPPSRSTARWFFFDCERWGLGARERELLSLLRPHLSLWRSRWNAAAADPALLGLTPRESEILKAAAAGQTNAQIAARLWISHHTVRKHLEHVFDKLGVHTRTEAAALLGSTRSPGSADPEGGTAAELLRRNALP